MAYLPLCLLAVLSFAARSHQAKNPINDFCRRWGHQTAQVDGKLYVDGGLVSWNPPSANPQNDTNTWLLFNDLNSTTQDVGMPYTYANLTKNATVPSVSGGTLWADEVNKCFYLFGGEFQSKPSDFSFWAYDIILNQWNQTNYTTNANSLQRVAYGAGTQVEELGFGFYYGGWMSNQTSPNWNGPPVATSNMIWFDFSKGTLNNNTGPSDGVGRAEGQLLYLPASDGGLLVYFGGVEDPYRNGTSVPANMSSIHIYDISSSKWYTQNATGNAPGPRRQFCAGATWADDHSSYNIYLYGGYGFGNVTGYDDAYILSLPSFTWINAWNTTNPYPHGGCTANVVNRDQMIILGGWFPETDQCDSPNSQGQHNMNLGYNGPQNALWDKYNPTVTKYFVPTPVVSAIGGGPTGGATVTQPASWNNPDLRVYFDRVPTFGARAATRSLPTNTADPSSTGKAKKTNIGSIAGGVVGGLVALIAILSLILFCLHRRKKALKNGEKDKPPSPPPAELAATSPVQEMPSPGTSKYLSIQSQSASPGMHPAYAGDHSIHSRSPSNDYYTPASPYPLQNPSNSPTTAAPFPSPYNNGEFQHQSYMQQNGYAPCSDHPHPNDTQNYDPNSYSQSDHQSQYSYPTPHSPTHPPFAPFHQQQQQQHQVYYPPPPEPSHHSYSNSRDSPNGTQYSTDTDNTPIPPSTTNTPAQFYAQPVPVRGPHVMSGGASLTPNGHGGENGDHGFQEGGGSLRGSVDSRRRMGRGRFVEVDHM